MNVRFIRALRDWIYHIAYGMGGGAKGGYGHAEVRCQQHKHTDTHSCVWNKDRDTLANPPAVSTYNLPELGCVG